METPSGSDRHREEARGRPPARGTPTGSAAVQLSRLARDLQQQLDAPATMQHVVDWAVQLVPGAEHASVSLVHRRREITSAAVTGEVPRRFDQLQQEVGQGPCLDAMYEHETVRVDDLAGEARWPELARRWGEVGVRSALCLQLFVRGQDLGALNVLAARPGAFDDESEHWGLLVASHGAVALAAAVEIEGLTRATVNRTVIGQAEGILMERLGISAEVAFAVLVRTSQDVNRKLHLVAEDLVRTGKLPTASTGQARRGER
ncbi:GAF and ANTAR domain-containing protein [Kineococcus gypseus]|uniref:GAF and ANTAR domain-containing protein n=1 Tax=Kineococcus gypseus TaxID=1637102 RepID=UPI003D7D5179